MNVRPPKARPTRVRRRQPSRRQLTTILWEKLEARWVLTGPYVNAQLSQNDMDTLVTGLDGLSAYGRRLGDSGYYAEPLKGIRHQDGSPVTIGAGNPLGRPVEEGVANPLRDYYAVSQPTDWDTDALLLQWDGDDAPQQLIPEYKRDAGPRLAAGEVTLLAMLPNQS